MINETVCLQTKLKWLIKMKGLILIIIKMISRIKIGVKI